MIASSKVFYDTFGVLDSAFVSTNVQNFFHSYHLHPNLSFKNLSKHTHLETCSHGFYLDVVETRPIF